ncbi:hypothetical protein CHZ32_25355, partial [Salmonella enterica]|nr:hypothetical protein [Salmonella enterica]
RRSDGNTSISPENIAGQSLSVGFRPLPQTTPYQPAESLSRLSIQILSLPRMNYVNSSEI